MRYWRSGNTVWEPLHCVARQPWQTDFSSRFSVNLVSFACLIIDLALTSHNRVNAVKIKKSLEWVLRISKLIAREFNSTDCLRANILYLAEVESIILREENERFDFERYLNICSTWFRQPKGHSGYDVNCNSADRFGEAKLTGDIELPIRTASGMRFSNLRRRNHQNWLNLIRLRVASLMLNSGAPGAPGIRL
jgi:hypothetical protein